MTICDKYGSTRDGSHAAAILLAVDRRVDVEAGKAPLAEPSWRDRQAAYQDVNALAVQLAD